MIRLLSLALSIFIAHIAQASPLPCSPVFLAGPQGRPIPGAAATFKTLAGAPVSEVWTNAAGTTAFTGAVPVSQILQVYIEPGIYIATVSGSGITKEYQIVCTDGFGSGLKMVSFDRTADLLLLTTGSPPQLECSPNKPCNLDYDPDQDQVAIFDFILPSAYPLTVETLQLSWHSPVTFGSPGDVVWDINWCLYNVGDAPCDPTLGGHSVTKTSRAATPGIRVDVSWSADELDASTWVPNAHVVMAITRTAAAVADTLPLPVGLENIQIEFLR